MGGGTRPADETGLVPRAVASVLGVKDVAAQPLAAAIASALRSRRMVLVLDNCEHLLHACAELAETLLRTCPELRILATSREPLSVLGEIAWRVPALTIPRRQIRPMSAALESDAARLFLERAHAASQNFQLSDRTVSAVLDVCRRLEGIPLALELAAARIRSMSVDQLAQRLDDALGILISGNRTGAVRQRTLRAAIDWSYQLLNPPDQVVFSRLAVFAGGFDLAAAESVCSSDRIESVEVLNVLCRAGGPISSTGRRLSRR